MILLGDGYLSIKKTQEQVTTIDQAFDGRYEMTFMKGRVLNIANPDNGKWTRMQVMDGCISSMGTLQLPCAYDPSADEQGIKFNWDRRATKDDSPLTQTMETIVRSHETELKANQWGNWVPLSESEQVTLGNEYAKSLANDFQFLAIGDSASEMIIVPTGHGWLPAIFEFVICHPMISEAAPFFVFADRYDRFVSEMGQLGIPAEAISQRQQNLTPPPKKPVIRIDVDAQAVRQANLVPADGQSHILDLPSMRCELTPNKQVYKVMVYSRNYPSCAKMGLARRMKDAVRIARLQSDKPLADTKGAKVLAETLA